MDIKNTEERAELIWQLNKVGDYNTHKELWDAYYKLEELVKNCSIPDVVHQREQFKSMVFDMANKLAIAGHGDEAVMMHKIHNRL